MTDRSAVLLELGRAFLEAHPFADFVASTTGGSVARGEADQFSDLDINVYVDGNQSYSANGEFRDEIIQFHIHPFPSLEAVRESAWGFRFLGEAGIVTDPTGRYEAFAGDALDWLDSEDGRSSSMAGALREVSERRSWATRCIEEGHWLAAGMASVATMVDAALLHRAFASSVMATGSALTSFAESAGVPQPGVPWEDVGLDEAEELLEHMAHHRRWLSARRSADADFVLDQAQDLLERRKADRFVRAGDARRLGEMLYEQTFWVINTRAERPFEEHFSSLPMAVRSGLRRIGFDESDETTVKKRLAWAERVAAKGGDEHVALMDSK